MKQLKFFIEMAAFFSVVPVMVFARIHYSKKMDVVPATSNSAKEKAMPGKAVKSADDYVSIFPGLINSQLIVINY